MDYKVRKKWILVMEIGTNKYYSSPQYLEPNENDVLNFIKSIMKDIGLTNKKITVQTEWEIL